MNDNNTLDQTNLKRKCISCGKEIYESVDICPYCKTDNSDAKEKEQKLKEYEDRKNAKKGMDLSFKVYDEHPIEIEEYEKELAKKKNNVITSGVLSLFFAFII